MTLGNLVFIIDLNPDGSLLRARVDYDLADPSGFSKNTNSEFVASDDLKAALLAAYNQIKASQGI